MQLLSRREVVKGGLGIAAATLPFAHVETALALAQRATGAGTPLTRSTFSPLVGTRVEMLDGSTSTMVRLVKLGDLQPAQMAGNEKCFSLVFQASSRAGGGQKIYRFRSTTLGTLSLFAVPGADGTYEVVVNNPF
jgi:hypothetical protein